MTFRVMTKSFIGNNRYTTLFPHLDEKTKRLVAASDCVSVGGGGSISEVAKASGLSRPTLYKAIKEIHSPTELTAGRVRQKGGGRKSAAIKYPKLAERLAQLVASTTRGDPMSPLLWTTKSTRKLAEVLTAEGIKVSHRVVAEMLADMNYSLQANSKTIEEGSQHVDRDAQFEYLNAKALDFMKAAQPVISVDAKKKELVGQYKNGGREWAPAGTPETVNVHDFMDKKLGRAIPYGIYDVYANQAWVSVGSDHDTASFAVESIRRWWESMGTQCYPKATRLLICADGGGSNGHRVRLWKKELQSLAQKTGLIITVCHLPPGTSKWNKIEHRLFSHMTMNWRGRPLISHEVIIELIAKTTTAAGLLVRAARDAASYPLKTVVSDEEMNAINIERDAFHGDWNYSISPAVYRPA